jgi:hypothetical protein
MELFNDPEIPTTRRSIREPHHSHNLFDITAAEMELNPGKHY